MAIKEISPIIKSHLNLTGQPESDDLSSLNAINCDVEVMNVDVHVSGSKNLTGQWRFIFTLRAPHSGRNMYKGSKSNPIRNEFKTSKTSFAEIKAKLLQKSAELVSENMPLILESWSKLPLSPDHEFSLLMEAVVYFFVWTHPKITSDEHKITLIDRLLAFSKNFNDSTVNEITPRHINAIFPKRITATEWEILKKTSDFTLFVRKFQSMKSLNNPFETYISQRQKPKSDPAILAKRLDCV